MLATEAGARRRTVVGLLGFIALEGATFHSLHQWRGTYRRRHRGASGLAPRAALMANARLLARLAGVFVALVATFGALFYGGVTNTGYAAGEITLRSVR